MSAPAPSTGLPYVEPRVTAAQIACIMGFCPLVAVWLYAEGLAYKRRGSKLVPAEDRDMESTDVKMNGEEPSAEASSSTPWSFWRSTFIRLLMMDPATCLQHRDTLRAGAEFGFILIWYYICDRTTVFPTNTKSYNRDLFIFIYFLLIVFAWWTSMEKTHDQKILSGANSGYLNRDQTEEWKGWMQVLFLLYHYFNAAEMYNAIRVFIAAYVWMTGFGNFSYYYVRKDFSVGRFAQMMWRLNFFVFFCCVVLDNSYMLYYICPMHTLFTWLVFIPIAVGHQYNSNNMVILFKFAAALGFVYLVWDVPGVFELVWGPLEWLLGYKDPAKPNLPMLHEWKFRSGLDRYVWIWGMFMAFIHPRIDAFLRKIEELEPRTRELVRYALAAVAMAIGVVWFQQVYVLPKLEYNVLHPYTSFIPITTYIALRNASPLFRQWSMHFFAFLGKITLETYISQFHIWLRTTGPDTQPKLLLVLIPDYPLCNFVVVTVMYTFLSYRLFNLTNTLKNALVPLKDNNQLLRNTVIGAATMAILYVAAALLLTAKESTIAT